MIEKMELGEFYKELRLARKLKQFELGHFSSYAVLIS